MKKRFWLVTAGLILILATFGWFTKATSETYDGMSIIPEEHADIPLFEGLEPRRHDYVIEGRRWESIHQFYLTEMPNHSWELEYKASPSNWSGSISRWTKPGFEGALSISTHYNNFKNQTEVIFDKIGLFNNSEIALKVMDENGVKYGSLFEVKQVSKRGLIVLFSWNYNDATPVGVAYIEKRDGKWRWVKATMGSWAPDGFNFGGVMVGELTTMNEKPPYIYYGTITNPEITRVTIHNKRANIVQVKQNKWIWYHLDGMSPDKEVKAYTNDGTQVFPDL